MIFLAVCLVPGKINSWYGLQELVLRDNKLTKIPDVTIFIKLLVFDVSFNEITSLHGLSKVSSKLKELYVSKNEVAKIEEIDHLHELLILELGSNRLRVSFLNSKVSRSIWNYVHGCIDSVATGIRLVMIVRWNAKSGDGEFAEHDTFTRAVAWAESN